MRSRGPARSVWPGQGYSLIELMFVVGVLGTVAGLAIPTMKATLDDLRTRGAVRYLAGRLQDVRIEALVRNASVALRVERDNASYVYGTYVDGNRNGVRAGDIERGVDRRLRRGERLSDQFPGVDFGVIDDVPAVDASGVAPGNDPVKLGGGDMVVFTGQGTATSGSLYVRGPGDAQFVVRIFGETGKTRMLRFDRQSRTWKPL
jgi:prepilin-type N-terminal cleavage/methylation domain-containing protein